MNTIRNMDRGAAKPHGMLAPVVDLNAVRRHRSGNDWSIVAMVVSLAAFSAAAVGFLFGPTLRTFLAFL